MPCFKCTFINESGKINSRILFGDDRQSLFDRFSEADEKLIKARRILFKDFTFSKLFRKKINYATFHLFNQELIALLKSGMSFLKALDIIIETSKNNQLKEVLMNASSDIRNGIQISEAFSSTQIPFQKIYKASLLAGEKSGNIITTIQRFNAYLERINSLKKKLISSLTYPAILFFFMITMVAVITIVVIPKFVSFYENFEAQLPGITRLFLSTAEFLKQNILIIIAIICMVLLLVKIIEKAIPAVFITDYLKMQIPFVGKIVLENAMAVFTRTLSILISGGIPIPESATIALETFSNRYIYSKVKHTPQEIKGGNQLSQVLEKVTIIPRITVEMIRVGESSGTLNTILDESADFHENRINTKISTLISLIEPVIIICLGLVIALMLISVYLPIFSTIKVVR